MFKMVWKCICFGVIWCYMNVCKGEFMMRERDWERKKKRIMISNNNLFMLFKDKIFLGGINYLWKRLKILNLKCGMFFE